LWRVLGFRDLIVLTVLSRWINLMSAADKLDRAPVAPFSLLLLLLLVRRAPHRQQIALWQAQKKRVFAWNCVGERASAICIVPRAPDETPLGN
jgi:hypothetical protein